jgi:hypothetical protein
VFHSAGLGCTGLAFLLLFLQFSGRIRRSGWLALLLLVSWVFLAISGVAIVMDAQTPNNDTRVPQPNVAIPMQWTAVVCIFLACLLQAFENLSQKWTLSKKRVLMQNKSDGLGWFRYNSKSYSKSSFPRIKDEVLDKGSQDMHLSTMEAGTMRSAEDESSVPKQINLFIPPPIRSSRSAVFTMTNDGVRNNHDQVYGSADIQGNGKQAQQTIPSIVLDPAD